QLSITMGWLALAADDWGLDAGAVLAALQGASTATSAARVHQQTIAAALAAAAVRADGIGTLDDIRSAGPEAATALDRYLDELGWRLLDGNELAEAALVERPALITASIRAAWDARATDDRPATRAAPDRP